MGGTELMVQAMAVVLMHGLCAGLYTWPLAHRPHYRLRLALCLAAGAVLGYAYWRSGLAAAHLQWWQLVVVFLYVAAMVLLLCDQPLFGSLYCAAWMMMTQQFFIQVYNAWFTWMSVHYGQAPLPWLCVVLFAGAGSFLVYTFVVRGMAEEGRFQVGPRQTISALLLFVVFEFLTASIVVDFRIVSVRGSWVVILMCEFYCLTILFLQNALFKKSAIQHDLDALDLLWHRQKEQYLLARKNIALINRRCHDLKVQIYALRDMADSGERRRYLDEIDDSIGIYDSIVKTGSEVLDTILTEKSLLCRDRDIHIQCVADGSRMGFLDPADTYAIFGNALDNAIEACEKLPQGQRLVTVKTGRVRDMLLILVENTMDPQAPAHARTTKGDTFLHGYGLANLRRTAEGYGGHVLTRGEGGVFTLKILLPIPQVEAPARAQEPVS